jgi:DNA-binding IscR family transcriptional regulator
MLDVIEAIDGPLIPNSWMADGLTDESQEKLRTALEHVALTARHQLESIKLSQIINSPSCATIASCMVDGIAHRNPRLA